MSQLFKSYDALRLFCVVCDSMSITQAAERLNLSKGAVSHQVTKLEKELGFAVFNRVNRGLSLTPEGTRLLDVSRQAFKEIEAETADIRNPADQRLIVGTTTYFASRWLSPRIMRFLAKEPSAKVLLEHFSTYNGFTDTDLDIVIRWGSRESAPTDAIWLLSKQCYPVGGPNLPTIPAGQEADIMQNEPLIDDSPNSQGWKDWFKQVGVEPKNQPASLVIRDPNVRVASLLSGKGIALMDELVSQELADGSLTRLSEAALEDYGYYAQINPRSRKNEAMKRFLSWLADECRD